MSNRHIKEIISSAGRNLHTIIITAREDDGSIETREAEPYSYRRKGKTEKFFCYDIRRDGIRNFHVDNIIFVEETENTFYPRWIVEVQAQISSIKIRLSYQSPHITMQANFNKSNNK